MALVHVALAAEHGRQCGHRIAEEIHHVLREMLDLSQQPSLRIVSDGAVTANDTDADGAGGSARSIVVLIYLIGQCSERTKRRLFGRIGERLTREFGIAPDALSLGIFDTSPRSWSFGYNEAEYRQMLAYQLP